MKNKFFSVLSLSKRREILSRILRSKTDNLILEKEETMILNALESQKQVRICVVYDINEFISMTHHSNNVKVIYGKKEIDKIVNINALVESSVAVIVNTYNKKLCRYDNKLLIYIPKTRCCHSNCVRDRVICENIENYDTKTLCCGLQRVQGRRYGK